MGTLAAGDLEARWISPRAGGQRAGYSGYTVPSQASQTGQVEEEDRLRAPVPLCLPHPMQPWDPSLLGLQGRVSSPSQGDWQEQNRHSFSFTFLESLILCLSASSHLIPLWHVRTASLFFGGILCHRGYCRRLNHVHHEHLKLMSWDATPLSCLGGRPLRVETWIGDPISRTPGN